MGLVEANTASPIIKSSRSGFIDLFKDSFLVLCAVHWVSCAWCLVAQLEESYGLESWETLLEEKDILDGGAFVRYLFGVEFAVFSLVLSHGRTYPESWIEQLFSLVVMMGMGTLYAFALGQATSLTKAWIPPYRLQQAQGIDEGVRE